MKIYVLNFHRRKEFFSALKLTAFLLIFVLLASGVGSLFMNSKRYADAMTAENEANLFIIDAGHGGEDSGAVGKGGVLEKDLNLEIAYAVGSLLAERGYAVLYTRTEDKLLYTEEENIKGIRKISDLKNRCKIAAEYPKATFISIHMNSYGSPKYSGLQVYYSERNESSRALANSIQARVKRDLQNENNRKTKGGKGLFLLENLENTAILIECGFLTNAEECQILSEKEYQKQLSLAIVCGIIEYRDNLK